MSERAHLPLAMALLIVTAACGGRIDDSTETASTAPAAAGASGHSAGAPHGDHSPHHGGTVLMDRDLHYEIVIEPAGRYAVYFTDAVRSDLPAAVASDVVIEVDRQKGEVERIALAVDASGECWEGRGAPVATLDASIHVGFTTKLGVVDVDLPFKSYWKPDAAGAR